MADGVDIDLYADDVDQEFSQEAEQYNSSSGGVDLYDDVITAPSDGSGKSQNVSGGGDASKARRHSSDQHSGGQPPYSGKRVSLYVGNLTWWTTDNDLKQAVNELGVKDLQDIKFFENRANGQSKGFAAVHVGSDNSYRLLMHNLGKKEIHGQLPMVTPHNKQSFGQFDQASKKAQDSRDQRPDGRPNQGRDDRFNPHNNWRGGGQYKSFEPKIAGISVRTVDLTRAEMAASTHITTGEVVPKEDKGWQNNRDNAIIVNTARDDRYQDRDRRGGNNRSNNNQGRLRGSGPPPPRGMPPPNQDPSHAGTSRPGGFPPNGPPPGGPPKDATSRHAGTSSTWSTPRWTEVSLPYAWATTSPNMDKGPPPMGPPGGPPRMQGPPPPHPGGPPPPHQGPPPPHGGPPPPHGGPPHGGPPPRGPPPGPAPRPGPPPPHMGGPPPPMSGPGGPPPPNRGPPPPMQGPPPTMQGPPPNQNMMQGPPRGPPPPQGVPPPHRPPVSGPPPNMGPPPMQAPPQNMAPPPMQAPPPQNMAPPPQNMAPPPQNMQGPPPNMNRPPPPHSMSGPPPGMVAPPHNSMVGPPPVAPVQQPHVQQTMPQPQQVQPPVSGAPPALHVNPAFFPGQTQVQPQQAPPQQQDRSMYDPSRQAYNQQEYRPPTEPDRQPSPAPQLSEAEFEEIMNRNRNVSSSAIARAVNDASSGRLY
nr:cleavage and polyadenylation specificity factor subunit 6-like [Lytechinus pictus]